MDCLYALCANPCVTSGMWLRTTGGVNSQVDDKIHIDISIHCIGGGSYPANPADTTMDYLVVCS